MDEEEMLLRRLRTKSRFNPEGSSEVRLPETGGVNAHRYLPVDQPKRVELAEDDEDEF